MQSLLLFFSSSLLLGTTIIKTTSELNKWKRKTKTTETEIERRCEGSFSLCLHRRQLLCMGLGLIDVRDPGVSGLSRGRKDLQLHPIHANGDPKG